MEKQYDCKECANAATPICERCVYITRPDGSVTKPTWFIKTQPAELIENMTEEEKQEAGVAEDTDLAVRIMACIVSETAIPLRYVMRYNALRAYKEGGNGQTAKKADDAGNNGERG